MDLGKVPPHDIDAEQAVLGSMLTDKDAVVEAIEVLKSDDFYRQDNKTIYEAILNLYNRAEPIDIITVKSELTALGKLEIDEMGLDDVDRKILETLIIKYQGRPVGIETIATTIGEETETVEDVYEPYLIQIGFIARTVRGRIATPAAYSHIGVAYEG